MRRETDTSTIEQTITVPEPIAALRCALEEPDVAWPHVELRDHQLEALDELVARLAHGVTRTWVDAPTGSGKTITFCAVSQAVGGSVLILVPRRNLAEQTRLAFTRFFPTVTVHPEGLEMVGRAGVTISTYQAALRHQGDMNWEAVRLLICDEAHTALGAQTRKMLDRAENAIVVGFTATGSTTTGHVEQIFGPVAATLDRQSAIDRGILCPLRSLRVERDVDLSDVAKVRGDFDQGSLGRALDRALWHKACADVWVQHFQPLGLAGVAYTATVAQAHALADEMTERGVQAAAVSGQTPLRELQRVLKDFGREKIDVLCNADLLTEGWDEVRATVVMHLAPTTSERVFVQRLGRVMRPAPDKEAVSVEFLPAGDPMGVQTSHDIFGHGWYKPLGRVAGPADTSERGKLADAARLLAEQEGGAKLVNPAAAAAQIIAGFRDGGWRQADPANLPRTVMEEWVEAASQGMTLPDLTATISAGIDTRGAHAWWALSGLLSRRAKDQSDQPLWRAWAMALLLQGDLKDALPVGAPRAVLDRLRMSGRERLRALWWHGEASGKWDRLTVLEQLGRSGERRRRWQALDEASSWAPAWAWDVSRGLADDSRPGRNQEIHRIAAWEASHLIRNGGELALIVTWLRAVGDPPPEPVPPDPDAPSVMRLGQAARLMTLLGPGDLPMRPDVLRAVARGAAACGGWARMRGVLDAIDLTTPDAIRALRAAIGSSQPKALSSRRAWNALRARAPRLPAPSVVGIGAPPAASAAAPEGEEGAGPSRRRRRRRRMRVDEAGATTVAVEGAEGAAGVTEPSPNGEGPAAPGKSRRRRKRRRGRAVAAGGTGIEGAASNGEGSAPAPAAD